MDCLKMVRNEIRKGWTGPNRNCKYGPCHYVGQDCTYCFCPFYPCNDDELGENIETKNGKLWSCLYCHLIHRTSVCKYIDSRMKELRIKEPTDKRSRGLLDEAKELFMKPGRSIMVLGATSDAGKSIVTAALCRVLSKKGFSVTPMKTQNMSLNSMMTPNGSEVASIQMIQAKAARIKHPDHHINPILIKPVGNDRTQAIVHGEHFNDYDVNSYYEEFIPAKGTEAVKESIAVLRKRYEYVVMEGAGSPAEMNIYDKDIANMRAAVIADADCILVVNMKWGGAFAYALGTVELLPEEDRKRVKGIILNNMYGDASSLKSGIEELESILKIPVLGVIPHVDIPLPAEDSMVFKESAEKGVRIYVINLPKMANFTDLDPLYHENVSVIYTKDPKDLKNADVIIIPGTKDPLGSMEWMRSAGMDNAITEMKGKIPIVGICGGYQIMCGTLSDPLCIEGKAKKTKGLGLFDATTSWKKHGGKKATIVGKFASDGDVRGYEMHAGETVTKERPLFMLLKQEGMLSSQGSYSIEEGSSNPDKKLFGTYVHGLFDEPVFRKYILKMTGKYVPTEYSNESYEKVLDKTLDELADVFTSSINMKLFDELFTGGKK